MLPFNIVVAEIILGRKGCFHFDSNSKHLNTFHILLE